MWSPSSKAAIRGSRTSTSSTRAHWDHLGVGPAVNGDRIYNGAKDNAVGHRGSARDRARVHEAADAAQAVDPVSVRDRRRAGAARIAVLLGDADLSAREDGRQHQHRRLNVNGRTKDITLIGYGASDLDDYVKDAAGEQGRVIRPDPEPEKGFYYRSDHFNFAKQGVPALDPDEGIDYVGKPPDYGEKVRDDYTEHDYHQPSDVVRPDWDLSGAHEDLKVFFAVGYRVAEADKMPEWKPGNEFKAKRDAMLKGGK